MNPELAKRLLATADGKELAVYITALVHSLDTVTGIKLYDPVEATVELKARAKAIEKLREALSTLLTDQPRGTLPDERDSFKV